MSGVTREGIRNRCVEEGLTLMADIFEIVLDRGEATEDEVMEFIDRRPSVQAIYETHIVGGIDELSDRIRDHE